MRSKRILKSRLANGNSRNNKIYAKNCNYFWTVNLKELPVIMKFMS